MFPSCILMVFTYLCLQLLFSLNWIVYSIHHFIQLMKAFDFVYLHLVVVCLPLHLLLLIPMFVTSLTFLFPPSCVQLNILCSHLISCFSWDGSSRLECFFLSCLWYFFHVHSHPNNNVGYGLNFWFSTSFLKHIHFQRF